MVECVTLSARLASYFNIKIRERGEQVYHGHLVTIKDGSEAEVAAEVQGSHRGGTLPWKRKL